MLKRFLMLTVAVLAAGLRPDAVAQGGSDEWFTPVLSASTNRTVGTNGGLPKSTVAKSSNTISPTAPAPARSRPIQEPPAGAPVARLKADTRVLDAADTNQPDPAAGAGVMDSLDNRYQLGPGDQILYQVIEDQDAPTNLIVTDSGDVEVPYYGLVHAAGKTCGQLAGQVKTLLEQKLYYRATVVLALEVANKAWVAGKVYVTGQVQRPGGYEIRAGENLTVSKAILDAGGFSDFSDKKHVRLIRKGANGDQTVVVNVQDVWKGQLNNDLPVQPGDLVVVPASMVNY
jgi:polysaccharide biosynthesis/export protein